MIFKLDGSMVTLLAGADITDYFNYGFDEHTWRDYCERQRKLRIENSTKSKIAVFQGAPAPFMHMGMVPICLRR